MLEVTDIAQSVLTRSHVRYIRAQSWLGESLLAEEIPIVTGTYEVDRSLNVPDRITFMVPRIVDGVSWSPVADDHPLAANGQRLSVQVGVGVGGVIEWIQLGWFLVFHSETDGDQINVDARGLLHWIHEARLISPFQPSGTLVSTIRGLVDAALPVQFDAALVDRAVPAGLNFDDSRLDAINTILDAWPAQATVTEDGFLLVEPVPGTPTVADISLTNGVGGTIIKTSGESTREDAYNAVVARGSTADGQVVQGVAYDGTGPKSYTGPFNPLPVPFYFESPLLTTNAHCVAAANTRLANIKRKTSKAFSIEMVPNPALQVGDTVSLTNDDYTDLLCSIETLSLPFIAGGGSQRLTVRSVT